MYITGQKKKTNNVPYHAEKPSDSMMLNKEIIKHIYKSWKTEYCAAQK